MNTVIAAGILNYLNVDFVNSHTIYQSTSKVTIHSASRAVHKNLRRRTVHQTSCTGPPSLQLFGEDNINNSI